MRHKTVQTSRQCRGKHHCPCGYRCHYRPRAARSQRTCSRAAHSSQHCTSCRQPQSSHQRTYCRGAPSSLSHTRTRRCRLLFRCRSSSRARRTGRRCTGAPSTRPHTCHRSVLPLSRRSCTRRCLGQGRPPRPDQRKPARGALLKVEQKRNVRSLTRLAIDGRQEAHASVNLSAAIQTARWFCRNKDNQANTHLPHIRIRRQPWNARSPVVSAREPRRGHASCRC